MDSPLFQIFQQVLSSFAGASSSSDGTAGTSPINNGTSSVGSPPLAAAAGISGLITLLFSFSALRDWLKLIVIGSVIETARRFAFSTYRSIIDSFFLTATFEEDDSSYDWVMVWLSKQSSWANARDVQISTRNFGLESNAVLIPGEEETAGNSLSGTRKLAYLPSVSCTYVIWYKRRRMTVYRTQSEPGYYGRREDRLQISHSFLNELLLEAKREYMAVKENCISVYVSDTQNSWRHVASRPKRPLNSIVLDPGVKDLLVEDAKDFLSSKSWYADRGIPFRRGYLLYGAPGTGKTSMIHSMAGELGLDVYVLSLSRSGLDDNGLNELVSDLPEKCIALMEDIDAAFHHGVSREASKGPKGEDLPEGAPPPPSGGPSSSSRITLSGLLNALDGVGAQEGRILYATTNKYGALDPALCRPGRMDLHVEFRLASRFQCRELFRRFYNPVDGKEEDEVDEEKAGGDDASESGDSTLTDMSSPDALAEEKKPLNLATSTTPHRSAAPKLRPSQLSALASRFADAIPEREFSMASLQGYLMMYKTRPFDAVSGAGAWVEKEMAERAVKVASSSVASSVEKP